MSDDERMVANRKARHDKKEAYLRAIYDRNIEQFRATAGQNPIVVANETHAAMDAVIRQDQLKDPASAGIRCGKGCSHCCHEPVAIWPHEAALLIEVMRKAGREFDRARLERQSRYTVETWRQQAVADKACGFLGKDGACTVYEFRPGVCRKLLVVTDPLLCDASQNQPDSVGRWFSWEAELMESAALETFGAGLMPMQLMQALDAQDTVD